MKPHIFKRAGLWYCRTTHARTVIEGLGYTAPHAYADWKHSRDQLRNDGVWV